MNKHPSHKEQINALRRIEGQVRGVQKMIEEKKYCIDILHQVHAAVGALARVEDKILEKHLAGCVSHAVGSRSQGEREKKLSEIVDVIKQFRKGYR